MAKKKTGKETGREFIADLARKLIDEIEVYWQRIIDAEFHKVFDFLEEKYFVEALQIQFSSLGNVVWTVW